MAEQEGHSEQPQPEQPQEHRPIPAPEAPALTEREQNIKASVTPARARFLTFAATKDTALLDPEHSVTQEPLPADLAEQIKSARTEDLPAAALNTHSENRRDAFWKTEEHKDKSFADKNAQWNEHTHSVVQGLVSNEDTEKQEAAKQALSSLGLYDEDAAKMDQKGEHTFKGKDGNEQQVQLYDSVEEFRNSYLKNKSDVNKFIGDIAKDCRTEDGSVDIATLTNRLDAIKPLLGSFGDKSVDTLVHDYGVSYGLLSQEDDETKTFIAHETQVQLQQPLPDEKKGLFADLALAYTQTDHPTVHGGPEAGSVPSLEEYDKPDEPEQTESADTPEPQDESKTEEPNATPEFSAEEIKQKLEAAIQNAPNQEELEQYEEILKKNPEDTDDKEKALFEKVNQGLLAFRNNHDYAQALRQMEEQKISLEGPEGPIQSVDTFLQVVYKAVKSHSLQEGQGYNYIIEFYKDQEEKIHATTQVTVAEKPKEEHDKNSETVVQPDTTTTPEQEPESPPSVLAAPHITEETPQPEQSTDKPDISDELAERAKEGYSDIPIRQETTPPDTTTTPEQEKPATAEMPAPVEETATPATEQEAAESAPTPIYEGQLLKKSDGEGFIVQEIKADGTVVLERPHKYLKSEHGDTIEINEEALKNQLSEGTEWRESLKDKEQEVMERDEVGYRTAELQNVERLMHLLDYSEEEIQQTLAELKNSQKKSQAEGNYDIYSINFKKQPNTEKPTHTAVFFRSDHPMPNVQ